VTTGRFDRAGLRPGRKLSALAHAVREHERTAAGGAVPKRPADHALYRRLTEIERGSHDRRNGA
jgi:hypothetical protein